MAWADLTPQQRLDRLRESLEAGVLEIRAGDEWTKYQSRKDMLEAYAALKAEIDGSAKVRNVVVSAARPRR